MGTGVEILTLFWAHNSAWYSSHEGDRDSHHLCEALPASSAPLEPCAEYLGFARRYNNRWSGMTFSWSSHLSNPPVSIQDCTRGLSFPSKASKSSPGAHRAAKAPGSWPGNFCALLQVGGSQPEPRLPSHCSDPHSVSEFFPLRFLRPVTEPRPSSLFQDLTLSFLPDQSCSEHPRETGC